MGIRFLFFILVLFAIRADLMAQMLAQKLDPDLKMLVKAVREEGKRPVLSKVTGADQPLVHIYIQGSPADVRRVVLNAGGRIGTVVGDLSSASIPPSALEGVAADPAVKRLEQVSEKTVYNDNSAAHSRVIPVHLGVAPLTQAYTGKGVLVGIIETGIDFRHLDFRDPQDPSRTRILSFWDQGDRRGPLRPEGFDYGTLWAKADIEATLAGEDVVRHVDRIGHGTHVTGTAVGNGSALGAYRGIAPDADIIFVRGINRVVDAVQFIVEEANKLGRPVAINYSAGDHRGAHDGTSLEEKMLDALIAEAPGRAFVAAAGNQGNDFMHWGGFNLGTETVWTYYHKDIFNTDLRVDDTIGFVGAMDGINGVVYNTDAENTFLAIGLDSTEYVNQIVEPRGFHGQTPWVSLKDLAAVDDVVSQTLRYQNGEVAGVVELSAQSVEDGKVAFSIAIFDYMSSVNLNAAEAAVGADLWRLMVRGSGEIHVWSYFVLSAEHRDVNLTVLDDGYWPTDNRVSVAMPATAKNAIAVGSYVGSVLDGKSLTEGDLVVFSSRGPSADGRPKPELTAPGENVISTLSQWAVPERSTRTGLHQLLSGTSMSAPVVTGAAALYFQQNPNATYAEVLAALTAQARADEMTSLPNSDWGFGKLDLFAALTGGAQPESVNDVQVILGGESAEGAISDASNRVIYRLILDSATEIEVDLFPTLLFDPVIDLFKGTSLSYAVGANRVGERVNGGGVGTPEKFQRTLNAGHYLFAVSAFEGGSSGTFTFKMSSFLSLISSGDVLTDRLVESQKVYQMMLDEAVEMTLSVLPDSTLNPVLEIFRGASLSDASRVGDRIDAEQVGGRERFSGLLEAGTYLVVISSLEGVGEYTLAADDFGSIVVGETLEGRLEQSDGVVYRRLELADTTDVVLSLSPVEEDLDVVLTLFKGSLISDASQVNWVGAPVDQHRPGWPEHWVGVLDPNSYLVAVSSFRGRSSGPYTLEFDSIHSLALNERKEGRLPAFNFWDFYRLNLTADTEIVLTLEPGEELNAVVDVFEGTSLFDAVEDNRVGVSHNAGGIGESEGFERILTSGSYIIWVSSFEGSSAGAYVLQVTGDGRGGDPVNNPMPDPVIVPVAASDFNGDGRVDFVDYLTFTKHFGQNSSDEDFDAQFDLDKNGGVGFSDFVLFAQRFGQDVG